MSDITTPEAVVPAGWYPDYSDPGNTLRYWDGNGWTPNRAPRQTMPTVNQSVVVNEPRKRVNHLLHLVLTILTAGLWLPVWIIVSMAKA